MCAALPRGFCRPWPNSSAGPCRLTRPARQPACRLGRRLCREPGDPGIRGPGRRLSPCETAPGHGPMARVACGQHCGAHGSPCSQGTERGFAAKATGARVAKIVTLVTARGPMPPGPHRPAPDGAGRQRDRQAQRNTDGPSVLLYEHRWAIGVHLRMCRRHGAGRIQRGAAAARPTAARARQHGPRQGV